MQDATSEISLEGALSSGKTTACLWKVFNSLHAHPGIHWWIGRYGDGETQTKVRPAFEAVCQQSGSIPTWNAKELCYEFANGSKCFAYGLKSPDALSRYSKMRGMGVAGIYNDQTEELPEDFSLELRLRLRQPGYPHQLIFSPNPPNVTHWLAKQFPVDNPFPARKYYAISIHDNAHNLPRELLSAALAAYPSDHAKHRSVILGLRGMNVTGEPVYKGAFVRALHEAPVDYDPRLTLEMGLDFGKHHPCVVFRQRSALGQVRFGEYLRQNLYLDDFLSIVLTHEPSGSPTPSASSNAGDRRRVRHLARHGRRA
jgi:PBSX family phage terminase large subunit